MRRAAQLFTKPRFFEPLSQNTDPLAGLHANTHLAQARMPNTFHDQGPFYTARKCCCCTLLLHTD
jgi:hypothetical protein